MPIPGAYRSWFLLALAILLGSSLLFSLAFGSSGWLWPLDPAHHTIVFELRWPRAVAAAITGGLLAIAGALMQVLLRNPLADPYVLGVSGGASAFVLTGFLLGLAWLPVPLLAFCGACISMAIVFVLGRGPGPWSSLRMLLTGVVIAAGWGAIITLLLALGPDRSLRGMLYWLMGDLSYAGLSAWWLLPMLGVTLILALRGRSLNIMTAGETQAALLGENTQRRHLELYLVASLLTALAVSIAGSIGFVGLVVPHLVRLIISNDHRWLIPASALFGASFLVLADTLARTVLSPRQLPVGVVTAIIGVVLFLILLYRSGRHVA